jgi:hypothetical protein
MLANQLPRNLAWAVAWLCALLFAAAPARLDAREKPKVSCTVAQLTQLLAGGGTDEQAAAQLAGLELSERLSTAALERLRAGLPGEKSKQELTILADVSSFLEPPQAEIDDRPTPDAAATRQMLVQVVNYVNTTLRQLPNFIATKDTSRFEDRPQEDAVEEMGTVSYSYQPLHFVGTSQTTLTYRNHGEVEDGTLLRSLRQTSLNSGMATTGEFGSILITVVADALKGKITWARWEKSPTDTLAVFHFTVPEDRSNYRLQFCCIVEGFASNGLPDRRVFDERVAYHGEIAFDAKDGTILRMTLQADMPMHELVPKAGIAVEYGPVQIGGKTYVCPVHSISLLAAHTTQQPTAQSHSNYRGPLKTFLNDAKFVSYRRFGSEVRIVPASQ